MNKWVLILVLAALPPLLGGCVMLVSPIGPSSEPGKIPPSLMRDKDNKGLRWDNPAAFGPVPADLQAKGNGICREVGFARATGYHPQARELDGSIIKGGGYFCVGEVK